MAHEESFQHFGSLGRPGPVGRLVRLLYGLGCLSFLSWLLTAAPDLLGRGAPRSIPFWLGSALAFYIFPYVVNIGFTRSWGRWPQRMIVAATAVAALASLASNGTLWSAPLTWLVLGWLAYFYTHLGGSFVLAAALGTPGCEMRALPHLWTLTTGRPTKEHHCPVGPLGRIDAWEAARRASAAAAHPKGA